MTIKEQVEQFKRECKSYKFYCSRLEDVKLALEDNRAKLEGVSSPHFKEVVIENGPTNSDREQRKLELLERKDKLDKEYNHWSGRITHIHEVFSWMPERDSCMAEDLLLKGYSKYKIAEKYGYSWTYIHQKIDDIIAKSLKKGKTSNQ